MVVLASAACMPLGPVAAAAEPAKPAAELLVKFEAGASGDERSDGHRDGGGTVESRLRSVGVDVVDLPEGQSPVEALESYRSNPDVEYAERNAVLSVAGASNDLGPGLWGLDNAGQDRGLADADIDAPEAWSLIGAPWATGGFTVGVVDTGIHAGHEDLAGKVVTPCFTSLGGAGSLATGCADDNGHGSHASGTIAASANNGRGIAGVAPGARVLMCKALDSRGSGYLSDIVACMNDIVARRSAHNIKVMSLSVGGGGSETLRAAVDLAWAAGVLVIAAAGNQGDSSMTYPAGYANAVSVAATDRQDGHASFSNSNTDVELSAPGVAIVSTVPGGYAAYSGTSMAAPHVAGAAALMAWKDGRTGAGLRAALTAAVDDLGPTGRDSSFGFGRLNLCKALGGSCSYSPGSVTPPAEAAPTAPAAPTPTVDRRAPRAQVAWQGRYDVRSVLQDGIRASCRSNEAATCNLSVELKGADARRVGLRGRHGAAAAVTIASGSAALERAGTTALAARLTQPAGRALAGGRAVEVTLRITVTDRAGNRTALSRRATIAAAAAASRAR